MPGNASPEAKLIEKVKKGEADVWGRVPMPPNAGVPDADVNALVGWIPAGAESAPQECVNAKARRAFAHGPLSLFGFSIIAIAAE